MTEPSILNVLSTVCECVCVWMKWCIIFITYDIVELFNMHKSFSFDLNIKFFAHKILNALSFQWFRFFGYIFMCDVACYRVGWLGFVITSFSV